MKTYNNSYFPSERPEGSPDGSDDFDDSDTSGTDKTEIEDKIVCEETRNP